MITLECPICYGIGYIIAFLDKRVLYRCQQCKSEFSISNDQFEDSKDRENGDRWGGTS
jgi:hypothetical protein